MTGVAVLGSWPGLGSSTTCAMSLQGASGGVAVRCGAEREGMRAACRSRRRARGGGRAEGKAVTQAGHTHNPGLRRCRCCTAGPGATTYLPMVAPRALSLMHMLCGSWGTVPITIII